MSLRAITLLHIRRAFEQKGLAAAVALARSCFDAGRLPPSDLAEVFLALRHGSLDILDRFIESVGADGGRIAPSG